MASHFQEGNRYIGIQKSKLDPSLFLHKTEGQVPGVFVVHVDDFLVSGNAAFIELVDSNLLAKYKMSKSDPLDTYLSPKITRSDKGKVYLSQTHYIKYIVKEHLPSHFFMILSRTCQILRPPNLMPI